jgi:GcrA cell cycle regulator
MGFFWTPEQDARLSDLLREGMSASQIGAELGVSRNAIIGRVGRNKELAQIGFARKSGWPGQRVSELKKRKSRAKPASELRVHKPAQPRRRIKVVSPSILFEPVPSKPLPEPAFVPGERLTVGRPIHMLGVNECRWAVNDAEKGELHLFCGAPSEGPWCECHRRRSIGAGTRSEQIAPRVLQAAA